MKNLLLTALALMAISANAQENVTIHNGNQSYSTTVEYITFDDVDENNLINVNALKSANENLSGQIEQISEGLENLEGQVEALKNQPTTIADDDITSAKIKNGEVKADDIADGAVAPSKLNTTNTAESGKILSCNNGNLTWIDASNIYVNPDEIALGTGKIFIGNQDGYAKEKPLTGDANISTEGVLTIENNAITSAKIKDGTIKAADIANNTITFGKLSLLSDAQIIIGNNIFGNTAINLWGDATMDNSGKVTIANDTITSDKIKNKTIKNEDLDKTDIPLSGFAKANDDIDCGGHKLIDVATPTADNDAANKAYVDGLKSRISQLEDTNAATNTTIANYESRISQLETDIANLTNKLNELTEAMAKAVQTE